MRKKQIMELLDGREMTPQEVAETLGISDSATRHLLIRYHLNGYLWRKVDETRNPGRGRSPYVYTLSNQGRKLLREDMIKTR